VGLSSTVFWLIVVWKGYNKDRIEEILPENQYLIPEVEEEKDPKNKSKKSKESKVKTSDLKIDNNKVLDLLYGEKIYKFSIIKKSGVKK